MEMGLFEIKERTHSNPDGSIIISKTTKVTGKGQQFHQQVFGRGGIEMKVEINNIHELNTMVREAAEIVKELEKLIAKINAFRPDIDAKKG